MEEVAVVHYVWSPVYVDALILRDGADSGDPQPVLYALQDANFNVTGIVSTAGVVLERYVQDPYGAVTVLTPAWQFRTGTLFAWNNYHQGLRFVVDVGLYYNRNRDYSPTLMRFVQMDLIGFWAGITNLYAYLNNNPMSFVDYLGLATVRAPFADWVDVELGQLAWTKIKPPAGWSVDELGKWSKSIAAGIFSAPGDAILFLALNFLKLKIRAIHITLKDSIEGCKCKFTENEEPSVKALGQTESGYDVGQVIQIPFLNKLDIGKLNYTVSFDAKLSTINKDATPPTAVVYVGVTLDLRMGGVTKKYESNIRFTLTCGKEEDVRIVALQAEKK